MMLTALITSMIPALAPAAPPDALPAMPAPQAWRLDVAFEDPQRIRVRLPGGREKTYWYMLFRVTNHTGRDVEFYPSIELVTSTMEVVEAGADVHPRAYDAIAARHRDAYPFLAPPAKVTGRLLQGEENSRASMAVFSTLDPNAARFTIFAAGFSGELKRIPNPAYTPEADDSGQNPPSFLLRRTLAIVYDIPGDPTTRPKATPVRRTREWVMR